MMATISLIPFPHRRFSFPSAQRILRNETAPRYISLSAQERQLRHGSGTAVGRRQWKQRTILSEGMLIPAFSPLRSDISGLMALRPISTPYRHSSHRQTTDHRGVFGNNDSDFACPISLSLRTQPSFCAAMSPQLPNFTARLLDDTKETDGPWLAGIERSATAATAICFRPS